jgi:hypothetical protein
MRTFTSRAKDKPDAPCRPVWPGIVLFTPVGAPYAKTLAKTLEAQYLARNRTVLGVMGSSNSSADVHPESVLGQIISSLLATRATEQPVAVVTTRSEDSTPLYVSVPELPDTWSEHVVEWDQIASRTQWLLNDGNKVLMVPPRGRRSPFEGEQEG